MTSGYNEKLSQSLRFATLTVPGTDFNKSLLYLIKNTHFSIQRCEIVVNEVSANLENKLSNPSGNKKY